eukprot:1152526-Pelagomonas_calceolata.AAC.10
MPHTSTPLVRERFKAECSAAAALEREARAAALAGTQLPHDLHLVDDGTVAVVDEGTLVVPPHPGFPMPQVIRVVGVGEVRTLSLHLIDDDMAWWWWMRARLWCHPTLGSPCYR